MAATAASDPRLEWRGVIAMVLTGIVAMTVYGTLGPWSVKLVSLPVTTDVVPTFAPEYWAWFAVPVAVALLAPTAATAIANRRFPSVRTHGRTWKGTGISLALALIAVWLLAMVLPRPTRGLEVLDEHTGAYIWASADLASNLVGFLGFYGVVFAATRIVRWWRTQRSSVIAGPAGFTNAGT
jgi:hypothetical protein